MRITSLFLLVAALALMGCDQTTDTMDTDTTDTPATVPSTSTPGDTATPGSADTSSTTPDPDNSARNAEHADGASKTPLDQDINAADQKITQEIRQKITNDGTMSANARNVKIVTEQGKVTLDGVVEEADEKQAIEQYAAEIAKGADNVTSKIEVNR